MDIKKIHILHMTHILNLASIKKTGCLVCDATMQENGMEHVSIAHDHIKARRKRIMTPLGCTLAECVPFYFSGRTPMLYAIGKGRVRGYEEGQNKVAYLVGTVQGIIDGKLDFCFTDGHAVEAVTGFYTDVGDLDRLDWKAIKSDQWGGMLSSRRRRLQKTQAGGVPREGPRPAGRRRRHRRS